MTPLAEPQTTLDAAAVNVGSTSSAKHDADFKDDFKHTAVSELRRWREGLPGSGVGDVEY